MKNTTYFSKQHIFRWLLLCWLLVPWGLQAQSSTHITWDSQVGCQVFRGEKGAGENSVAASDIDSGTCVRVCEGSKVKYTADGSNISFVAWIPTGGVLQTTSGGANIEAEILWGIAGAGSLQATITFTDGTVETKDICIEKINKPTANFNLVNLKDIVCKNTEVHFDNLSHANGGTDIVNYFWDFGDGTTSTAFEPSHTYTQAGGVTVTLTVTNKCGCSETTYQKLEITEAPPVQISCASVVCEGSTEKYSVKNGCKGEWKVIGGSWHNTAENEIEVKWDNVDPEDGFGYVMYRSECGCPVWTTAKIPVILNSARIKGESTVCLGKQYTYSLPKWPTTHIDWDVTGPGGGQLTYNQQRNEVLFTGNVPGTYTLTATYKNTLLLCGGSAQKTIVVEAPVTISGGKEEICVGTPQTFTATPNVPVIWNVTLNGAAVHTSPQPTTAPLDYPFLTPGNYVITAIRGGCESNAILIKVVSIPRPPRGPIVGEIVVCPNKPYVYSLSSPVPSGVIPVWSATNGTIQGSNAGNSATVIFNPGASSYSVSVAYRTEGTAACLSKPLSLAIKPMDINKVFIKQNSGPFCPSSTQTFEANLGGIVPDSMEWSFENPNFGSFVSGQGTPFVTVNINEVANNIYSTNLKLEVVVCGQKKVFLMPISKLALPVVSFTNVGKICLGSNLHFTVDQGVITSATDVTFTFANGDTYTTTFNPSGVYDFPNNGYIQNTTGGNVNQIVTVTYSGTNGCVYKPTASASFIILPETIITVSPVYNLMVCDDYPLQPYTLTANSSTGLTNIVEWQWFKNGVSLPGFNTNSYTLSGTGLAGTYQVRAKDINGCYVYSQEIKVINSCPTTSSCTAPPMVTFTPKWTGCNTITVNNLNVSIPPDEIQWVTNNVLTLVSPQGQPTATFQTNLAGAHIVSVRLRYGTCWYSTSFEVRKLYEPKFNIGQVCNGSGYNVTLYNSSTIFEVNPSSSIEYRFSMAGQPDQVGQTATYNNLAPGTYTFTMKMSIPSQPSLPACTITKTITLAPVPNANFMLPVKACKGEVITLSPSLYTPGNIYTWYFDGTSYVTSQQNLNVTFNTAGVKGVSLMVKTPQGCIYNSLVVRNITISEANLNGNLTPPNAVACEGTSPLISFVPAGTVPSGYIWMNGNVQVPGAPSSMNFVPTQSGNYWPVLVSADGCKTNIMSVKAVGVAFKKPPYVNISGQANVCANSQATLKGILTDNTLEYRWKRNGVPLSAGWLTAQPVVYNVSGLSAGTYTFTLEARVPGTTDCSGSKDFVVTVSNPPASPTITYTQTGCQPYKIQLTASGPANGEYNWSNGMSGQTITVDEGGKYKVFYTAPSGCKVYGQIDVPLSIESLMWVFPTGCYSYCREKDRRILGPKGTFDYHQWERFGVSLQNGTNTFIDSFNFVDTPGTYMLRIDQTAGGMYCRYYSGAMNYYPGKNCGIETQCEFEVNITAFKWDGDHYNVHGTIFNAGSQPAMLDISSMNGYGTYFPSMITIPAGGTYDMNANPLAFYPNASFPGGYDVILFLGQDDCKFVGEPKIIGKPVFADTGKTPSLTTASSLKLMPNPAKDIVKVSYNTGNEKLLATQIKVFDTMGNIKFQKELKSSSGEVNVDVSNWLQSTYIVIVQAGEKSLQGKLIKN